MNSPASIRSVRPPTCEIARTARDPPGTSGTPTMPSLPMVATSTMLPSASGVTSEITPSMGKWTKGMGWPGSKSTVFTVRCAGRRCSISAFRSTSGSASRRWLAAGAARTLPFAIRPFVRLPQRPHCGNFSEPPWENRWPSRCSSGVEQPPCKRLVGSSNLPIGSEGSDPIGLVIRPTVLEVPWTPTSSTR